MPMLSEFVLIQGVFFQYREWLDVATKPVEGTVAVVKRGLCHFQFAGVIVLPLQGTLSGGMNDNFGEAELSDITLAEETLRFNKKYLDRDYVIQYEFTKQPDGTWSGSYASTATGTGKVRNRSPVKESRVYPPASPSEAPGRSWDKGDKGGLNSRRWRQTPLTPLIRGESSLDL